VFKGHNTNWSQLHKLRRLMQMVQELIECASGKYSAWIQFCAG